MSSLGRKSDVLFFQVENAEVVCFAQNGSTVTEQEDKARIDSVGEKAVVSNPQVSRKEASFLQAVDIEFLGH